AHVIVDTHGPRHDAPALVFEAGEVGRLDPFVIHELAAWTLALLARARMAAEPAVRPSWRAVAGGVRRLRAPAGGVVVPLVPIGRMTSKRTVTARVVVEEYVVVRDSGGHAERRPVIQTVIVIGPITRRIRVTLTNRGDMIFPMLVGRTTLGADFVVDAAAREL